MANINILNASSTSQKFYFAKKNYVTAMFRSSKSKKIKYLKDVIKYGNALKKDVSKYKSELYRLDKKSTYIEKRSNSKMKFKSKKTKHLNKRYNITSVYVENNAIIINFKNKVKKSDIKFIETKKKNKYYDTFDISGIFKDAAPTKLVVKNVDKIIITQYRYKTLRISVVNKYNLQTYYIINNKQIIIKLLPNKRKYTKSSNKKYQNIYIPKVKKYNSTKKTIVIDAGHGGKDSGAVGPKRQYEKTVVLSIAKRLSTNLKKQGYHVYLTRSRDKYVSLRYRTKLANNKNADMFISIHANAARKSRAKKAHGIESYFLSPARSARAKRVAALENKGDMKSMGWSSKNSLLTILNQAKITAANKMAIDIQRNMLYKLRKIYGKKNIRDGGVREGPFWVLVGAQMPSVLVEVGYISHPKEGYRITTSRYQKSIAKGISEGIKSYFIKN
jgi:N-acetylmuramoyl-L-alanine amidase